MKEKTLVRIAAAQINPEIKKNQNNLDKILAMTIEATGKGADLVVFPECALSGYVYSSIGEALAFMENIPGPSTKQMEKLCKELNVHVIYGLLEKEHRKWYNTAVMIGPDGIVGKYHKVHLPFLGIDRFVARGEQSFRVFKTPLGKIGMNICYDCLFPESARTLAIQGADIIVLPTNWPQGRESAPKHIVPTRAIENGVFVVAVDRVGEENGARFIGQSRIVSPSGDVLAEASVDQEEVIYAEANLEEARQKRLIFKPGEFEVDIMLDRRPDFYGDIAKKN